ncbi:TraR/DksA C4-type zinc finger protein [Serratia fonticola]|uniref:TraR/DksA C4-type zinc finger protein n=1 Tax=Serratia fonticola TaxID=47917 RepID=UPI0015C668F5|nr:TraR/DksA C4-type zinc finger protein [Serratia fonticola]NXZ87931.1 TraR/DksA C4-type zinc finger protein [Serratia fonticola]
MADLMDIAQERQALILDAQIANARKSSVMPSAFKCEDCDAPIPEARRIALLGVETCVACQHRREAMRRHYAVQA